MAKSEDPSVSKSAPNTSSTKQLKKEAKAEAKQNAKALKTQSAIEKAIAKGGTLTRNADGTRKNPNWKKALATLSKVALPVAGLAGGVLTATGIGAPLGIPMLIGTAAGGTASFLAHSGVKHVDTVVRTNEGKGIGNSSFFESVAGYNTAEEAAQVMANKHIKKNTEPQFSASVVNSVAGGVTGIANTLKLLLTDPTLINSKNLLTIGGLIGGAFGIKKLISAIKGKSNSVKTSKKSSFGSFLKIAGAGIAGLWGAPKIINALKSKSDSSAAIPKESVTPNTSLAVDALRTQIVNPSVSTDSNPVTNLPDSSDLKSNKFTQ